VTPPVASNKRLQKRRRYPTVFCPFQRKFFSTALHLKGKDTIDLWVVSKYDSVVQKRNVGGCCGQIQCGALVLHSQKETKRVQFELNKNVHF
jgi:hypothetical protein